MLPMIDTLTATPFFGLGLSLLCWILAVKFQKKTGLLVCNPVLVSSLLVILVLVVFRIPLARSSKSISGRWCWAA